MPLEISPPKKRIAIVGTGISGLKAAHKLLHTHPHLISEVTFIEKNKTVGGVLTHTQENGFLFEHGAQGVLLSRPAFAQSTEELNIAHRVIVPPKNHSTRYLIQDNKCVPLSLHIFKLLKFHLLNLGSLYLILKELFFKKHLPSPPHQSVYDFFSLHFGKKIADTFIIPFCFGIWGGAAKKLVCRFCFPSLQKIAYEHGSLLKYFLLSMFKKSGVQARGLGSFKYGMNFFAHSFLNDIEKACAQHHVQFNLRLEQEAQAFESQENQVKVTFGSGEVHFFDAVIYAAQPGLNLKVSFGNSELHKKAFASLQKIPTHSLVVVGIGGKKDPHFSYPAGFGALAPDTSPDLLGVLFVHSTYPDHAPDNSFLYRVMLGGDRPHDVCSLSSEEILARTRAHLTQLQLISGSEPLTFQKVVLWKNYIPLSTSNHEQVLAALWQLEALTPGLFFTGNYIQGVSVSDCLEQATATAKKVSEFLFEFEPNF